MPVGEVVVAGLLRTAKRKSSAGLVGLEVSGNGIAIAHVLPKSSARKSTGSKSDTSSVTDKLHLSSCEFISADVINSQTATLRDRISALGLNKVPTNWVLPNAQYNLLLVETPNVEKDELREAMRWRIKELVTFPVENAVIDVFSLPEDGTRGAAMSYVVVTESQQIQSIVDTAHEAKINLFNIDIGELALRNLAEYTNSGQRGVCLIRLQQGQGGITLVKQEQLYLSRQFDLPYKAGLFDELPEDKLVLELQRSVDYYERQLGQVPPGNLLFCGENVSSDKLTESMQAALPGKSACLPISDMLNGTENWEEPLLQLCAGAIGGALRQGISA